MTLSKAPRQLYATKLKNWQMGSANYSAWLCILSLLLLVLGVTFLLLATWDLFRIEVIHFVMHESFLQGVIGLLLLLFAVTIFKNLRRTRPAFIVKLSPEDSDVPNAQDPNYFVIEVSEKAAKKEVEAYFMTLFPSGKIQCTTLLFPNKMTIQASLPKHSPEEQKEKVEEIESDLPWHLARKIGWTRPITLSLYFDQ